MNGTHKLLRFGVFELNLDTEELRKSGTILKLSPQPFRLLALLASHSGQIVTREEIKEQLWGEETFVDFEQGMNHCIKQIRTVLSDNADNPLYVETLPRRGYRFLAPVVSKNVPAPAPQIIKSKSGIQSAILPALKQVGGRATPNVPEITAQVKPLASEIPANLRSSVTSKKEPLSDSGVVAINATEAVVREEIPAAPPKVTSATAAAEALAPEIARLRRSSGRTRQSLLWIAAVIVLLIAGALYWYSHRP